MATAKTNGGSDGRGLPVSPNLPDLLALAEHDDEMVVAYDAEFRYTYVNPATERLIGPRESFLGRVLWEVTPHAVGTSYAEHYRRAMRERVVVEFEEHYPPRDRWNRVLCVPTADGGLVIRASDTTSEHRAELGREDAIQSLRQSEERHRRLVELLPEALYVNYQDRIVLANPAFLRLVGAADAAQVLGRPPFDFFHPDDHGIIRERIWRMLERDQAVPPVEQRMVRLDGTAVDVEAVGAPFPSDGKTMIQVVLRDISARKAAEAELRASAAALRSAEERQRLLLDSMPVLLSYVDAGRRYRYANRAYEEWFGVPAESILGRHARDLVGADVYEARRPHLDAVLERGEVVRFEAAMRDKDGRLRDTYTIYVPDRTEDDRDGGPRVRGAFVLVQDISERVEAERRLRASAEELRAAHARAAARAEREALVNRVGQAMRAAAGPGEVLAVAVRELGEAVGADRCYFVSYEPGRDWGRVGPDWHREGAGLSSMAGEYRLSDFAAVSADAAYVAGRTHVIEDIPEHARRVFPDGSAAESVVRLERLGLRALVRAPLAGSAGTFAALVVAMAGGPRRWTDDEITMVEAVAAQARAAVEAARARRDLEEDRAKQRRIAEVLQRALLIAPAPDAFAGAEVFPYYEAAGDEAQVGGDAYDVVRLDGGRVGLCLVDITGHGADAALFSADVRFSARNYLREAGGDPAECLRRLNRHVLDGQRLDGKPENVFVCAIVAVLDPATGALSLAAAGMEPPLILRATSGGVEAVTDVSGPILGALPDWPGAAVGLTLAGGDTLLLYTDGLSEARRGKGDFFGVEGVAAALAAAGPAAPLEAAAGVLVRAAKSFARSGVLDDDLCLLLCRRLGA